jgi:hypothetical protein
LVAIFQALITNFGNFAAQHDLPAYSPALIDENKRMLSATGWTASD